MRVTLATCGFPVESGRVVGGVAGVTYYLASELSRLPGVDVEIVTLVDAIGRPESAPTAAHGRWTLRTVPVRRGLWFYYDVARRVPALVARMADRSGADIVHVQNEAAWAVRMGKPCLFTVHGINELDTLHRGRRSWAQARSLVVRRTEGRARRRVRNVVCINPYVRQFLTPGQRVWEIENPVADSYFEVVRFPKKAVIFCAATVIPLKNIHGLIEAFAVVGRTLGHAELRIAGSGVESEYGRECLDLSRRLGVGERVHFLGSLSIEQLQQELAQASLLALVSFRETAPLSVTEAMAAGVPVLASDVGGVPALVEDGVTGRRVPPGNPARIAETMLRMLRTDDLRLMGAKGKTQAEHRFRASRVAERTLAAYGQIVGEPALRNPTRRSGNSDCRDCS